MFNWQIICSESGYAGREKGGYTCNARDDKRRLFAYRRIFFAENDTRALARRGNCGRAPITAIAGRVSRYLRPCAIFR